MARLGALSGPSRILAENGRGESAYGLPRRVVFLVAFIRESCTSDSEWQVGRYCAWAGGISIREVQFPVEPDTSDRILDRHRTVV